MKKFKNQSSSSEPEGQFPPNSAESIFGGGEFKFVQMKGNAFFPSENTLTKLKNSSSPEPFGQFQPNLAQIILG